VRRFIEACEQAGLPRNDDFNGPTQEGAGYFQLTTRNGRRWSTARGYLKPAPQAAAISRSFQMR
jgi:choline dehydrogenase